MKGGHHLYDGGKQGGQIHPSLSRGNYFGIAAKCYLCIATIAAIVICRQGTFGLWLIFIANNSYRGIIQDSLGVGWSRPCVALKYNRPTQ